MLRTINVTPCSGYHFGGASHIKKFEICYFQEINSISNFINKAIIIDIKYNPDEIYSKNDGYAGNCWTAHIEDSREIEGGAIIYNFRNFGDLVAYYEKEGFTFVNINLEK